jgi:hypothetical protein
MKKIVYIIAGAAIVLASSCKKYLDINENPNSVVTSTADLVLPQAIVGTAAITHGDYNTGIGADLMYRANAGGFSGFGTVISYDWTTGSFTAAWSDTYDNVNDYKYIKDNTEGKLNYIYFNAVARIMSAYMMGMLVDQYGDIPYTDAWKGAGNVAPKYDKAEAIYKDLAAQLDTGIALINTGLANPLAVIAFTSATDPLYCQSNTPNMAAWKQFANTVKLRLVVRAGGKVTFNNTNFTTDGFITNDAIVNPLYRKEAGKISPIFPYSATNAATTSSRLPSTYIVSFYDGVKLTDTKRGLVTFRTWPNPPSNQLGNETNPNPPSSPTPNSWVKGAIVPATGLHGAPSGTSYGNVGIMKDYTQGVPLITLAEAFFLQAEAVARGYITGDANALFNKGVEASFAYLYKDGTGNVPATAPYNNPAADATAYRAANPTSYLANYNLATSLEQRIEAIITQKYIAFHGISMHEAWNDYRRTGYPAVTGTGPTQTFVSNVSLATRPDRFPTRFLYPSTEYNTNAANIPTGVDKFKTLMFWAK